MPHRKIRQQYIPLLLTDTTPSPVVRTHPLRAALRYIASRPAHSLFYVQGFRASLLSAEKNPLLPESCNEHPTNFMPTSADTGRSMEVVDVFV